MSVTEGELREIEELRRKHATPGMTAGEFHEFLPERLRRPYWESKVHELLAAEETP